MTFGRWAGLEVSWLFGLGREHLRWVCDVLLADDRELLRKGIRATLEESSGFVVVAEAARLDEAVARWRAQGARLGIVGGRALGSAAGNHCWELLRAELLRERGGRRLLLVGSEPLPPKMFERLPPQWVRYLPDGAGVAELLMHARALGGEALTCGPGAGSARLTARELEVLRFIARGRRTLEIAVELGITRKTVETHRTSLMRKLQLHRLADLVRYAVRQRLVEC